MRGFLTMIYYGVKRSLC